MRNTNVFGIFLVFLLLVWTDGSAQVFDYNLTGAGARASGMGQAFIGVADDATAISWNPAGLTQLERMEVSAVSRIALDVQDFKFGAGFDDLDQDFSHFSFSFGSFAIPFEIGNQKLVAALAFQQQMDWYQERYNIGTDEEEKITGGLSTITPALAYRLLPYLSIGATGSFWFGKPELEIEGETLGGIDFSGLNFLLGVMLDLNGLDNPVPLKVGVMVRTPFELDGTVDEEISGPETLEMPLMFGVGASYRFGESLTLAADYELRAFGGSELTRDDGSTFPMSDSEEDLSQIRVGAEYLLISDFAVIPIRAGFQTVPTVQADFDSNGDFADQVTGTGFSLGSGLIFERFALDVAWRRISFEQKDDTDPAGTVDNARSFVTFSGIIYF